MLGEGGRGKTDAGINLNYIVITYVTITGYPWHNYFMVIKTENKCSH
jgi:hypothetical protein